MSHENEMERSVTMEINIDIEGAGYSRRRVQLYPGTEIAYGQGVDLAVSKALATISKVAYEIVTGADDIPQRQAIEAMLGKGVFDADE